MSIRNTANSYDKRASSYEAKWQGYLENTHQVLLNALDINDENSLLDVSAGTGLLASQILEEQDLERMVLNDVSGEMQSIARARLADYNNITFTNYSAEKLDFKPGSFDHVICLNAYHNYPAQVQFAQKAFDLLAPGGCLYILDWNRKGYFKVVNWLISIITNEIINTKSADEVSRQLKAIGFDVSIRKEWRYQYWELFLIKCKKP